MNTIIDFYCSDSQAMNDAIDRIMIELHVKKKKSGWKSILMSGCGKKSGTTTLTINLAIALSMSGFKTLLVDCDLRKGSKSKRQNNMEIGLSDYLSCKIEKEKVICKTNQNLLFYISSGSITNSPVRLLCSLRMEEFVEEVSNEYDYVIYDFPSLNIVSDASILFPFIDGIILVAALKQTTKRQLKDAKRKVEEYQSKYYGLIVNQVGITEYEKYIKDYDYFGEKNRVKHHLKEKKLKKDMGDIYETKTISME